MKTSLWMVVVLVSAIVGFLVGYSVSSHTGTRGLEQIEVAEEKAAPRPAPAAPAMQAGAATEKPAAAAAGPAGASAARPAAPAAASAASAEKPAAPKKTAPRRAPEKRGGTTGGY
jgi:hypothetical protein